MKILVTGATGFVGRHVINALSKRDVEIVATGLEPEYEGSEKLTYIRADILCDVKSDMYQFFGSPDSMIHLAWSGLPNYSSMHHIEENLMGNYNFICNMLDNGLKDVTVAGTCAEYGMLNGIVDEDMDTRPVLPYAIAKDSLRRFLEVRRKFNPFSLKWVRLFYLYGKGQSDKSLLSQLDKAIDNGDDSFPMSPGRQKRDYIAVEDAAEVLVKASLQKSVNGIVNCCSGTPVSIMSVVKKHREKRSSNIKLDTERYSYSSHEPMEFWGDTTKLNKLK